MPHNALRREIYNAIHIDNIDLADAINILKRALIALGGPVQDNRPKAEVKILDASCGPIDPATIAATIPGAVAFAPFAPIDTVAVQEPVSAVDSETVVEDAPVYDDPTV